MLSNLGKKLILLNHVCGVYILWRLYKEQTNKIVITQNFVTNYMCLVTYPALQLLS